MKNNFITKIIGATLAFAMMIGGAVGINANRQAKPVHADPGGTPTGNWTAITSVNDIQANTDYLLGYVYDNTAYYSKSTAVSSDALATSSTLSEAKIVRFVAVTGGWNIAINKNGNTTTYLGYGSSGTKLTTNTTGGTGAKYVWVPTVHTDGDIYFTTNNAGRFLGAASESANANIKGYATSNLGTYPRVTAYKADTSKVLSSISVATAPTKTTYYAGEFFDPTGLIITRTYSDSTSDTYTYANHTGDFSFTPNLSTALTTDNTSVTITYGEKTTTQAITVNAARTMTSIELHGTITKTEYYVGDSWDLDGLDIKVNWSSGDPTFVDLDDEGVAYECNPATATSTSVDSFDIEVMYSDFDEVFTVDGITVSEHPLVDILTDTVIGTQTVVYTNSWAEISNIEDYTGAKYMLRTMKPNAGYGYTMQTNSNGYMVTTYCPAGLKVKTITFGFLTNDKNLGIYASNTAYTAGEAPSGDTVGTVTGDDSSVSFDFTTLDDEYRYVAFKGIDKGITIGTISIEYDALTPTVAADPSSFELTSNSTREVEITVDNFASTPSLTCEVTSGASSIVDATVSALNAQSKATLTVEATNVAGSATIRVTATLNTNSYYTDVNVTVVGSPKAVVEDLASQASLSFKYDKHATVDTLTVGLINNESDTYADWENVNGSSSSAVYAGNTYGKEKTKIQLKSNDSVSGIVTTTSGGNAKSIKVTWSAGNTSNRTLDVYGKTTAYEAASDLYGENKGTKLGSLVYESSTTLLITGEYQYIGIRSNTGAIYLDSIEIQWGEATYTYSNVGIRFGGLIDKDLWSDLDSASTIQGYGVMISSSNSIKNRYNAVETSEGSIDGAFEAVQGQAYKLVKGTDIRAFYNQVSTAPAENGNNYFWNLFQRIGSTEEALNTAYTAVAFIRTADDGIVFLGEVTKSATQLAGEILAANPSENTVSEGSLVYLAGLAN